MQTRSSFVIAFAFTFAAEDKDNFADFHVTRSGPMARNFPVVTYRLTRIDAETFALAGRGGADEDDLPLEQFHADEWPLVAARRTVEREERRIAHFVDMMEPR
jgi:hypothetical protein